MKIGLKMNKKFAFKRGRAMTYSTQKPLLKNVDSGNNVERSEALIIKYSTGTHLYTYLDCMQGFTIHVQCFQTLRPQTSEV